MPRRPPTRSLLLAAALAALASLSTLQTASAAGVCAAATCKDSGQQCTRSSGDCPVCLTVTTFFFTSTTYCTDPSRLGECPNGYTKCVAPTPAPSPTPSPTAKPSPAPSPAPSPSPSQSQTSKPTTKPSATPTPAPGSKSQSPSTSSSSSSSSPLAEAKAANTNSSSNSAAAASEARSEASQLKPASVDTPMPDIAVTTTGASGSSSSIWIVIVACAVVACVVAAVVGTRYVARRRREQRDDSEIGVLGGKDLDVFPVAQRQTAATDFSDSALDLNATPSTSKFAYVPASRATGTGNSGAAAIGAPDGGVFLKSDAWRQTTSHNSFRGSHHINMSYIPDDPLTASQLSTSASHPARESHDVFLAPESPADSEWTTSGYFDRDGGHNSANTEFYSSKISAITTADDDDDDRQFTHRSSESLADKDSAKWKQKFYVEL